MPLVYSRGLLFMTLVCCDWTYGHGQIRTPVLRTQSLGAFFHPRLPSFRILSRNTPPRRAPRYPNPLSIGPVCILFGLSPSGPDIVIIRCGLSGRLAPKENDSSYEKEGAILPDPSRTTSLECVCDERSWLRQRLRLSNPPLPLHPLSALVKTESIVV